MAEYYNIQMDKPWGREGGSMADPEDMLRHEVIGISDGNYPDCRTFKEAPEGSIVLVREGSRAIALVEIESSDFGDKSFTKQFTSTVFRHVTVLDWADNYGKQPDSGLFHQGTFSRNVNPETRQYKYIDEWYRSLNR